MQQEIKEQELACCIVQCERPLDANYWDAQYQSNATGWDLGQISPPLKTYIDSLTNKNAAILIPGCGNAYEVEYLLHKGFTNITLIDIAPLLVENLKKKFRRNKNIQLLCEDFFEHQGRYDIIIEQTFFCAIPPMMRQRYVFKMHQLLNENGILAGLLFNTTFEKQGPPFGGTQQEYETLFLHSFEIMKITPALNSDAKRTGQELWFVFQKNNQVQSNCYSIKGLTCTSCAINVADHLLAVENVLHVSVNTNFSEILLVSKASLNKASLQNALSYDAKYVLD